MFQTKFRGKKSASFLSPAEIGYFTLAILYAFGATVAERMKNLPHKVCSAENCTYAKALVIYGDNPELSV